MAEPRPTPMSRVMVNVASFGAVGDGKADDTKAIQSALDAAGEKGGTVFVPDGTFRVGQIKFPPHTGLIGNATWSYREPGGAILEFCDASAPCMLNITGARGATIRGLSLVGKSLGEKAHAIFMGECPGKNQEDSPVIERCHISGFTGDGIHLSPVWCFSVRSCEIIFNQGNAMSVRGWDGFILDNWFSGNGGAGYASIGHHASVTMTGNRIEWNKGGGIVLRGGSHYNITGNYIDRSGGPGISLIGQDGGPCLAMTATGNVIYRSGKPEWTDKEDPYASAHVRIEGAHGVVFTGNSLCVGQDDGGGVNSPNYGIVLRALENSVVTNNTMHIGALKQLLCDLGEHKEGAIIRDNPGSILLDATKSIWTSPQR